MATTIPTSAPDIFPWLRARQPGHGLTQPVRDPALLKGVFGRYALHTRIPDTHPETYLDGTATTRLMETVRRVRDRAEARAANPHTTASSSSELVTDAYAQAHDEVLKFVNAPRGHIAAGVGFGATGAINRILRSVGGEVCVVTAMNHHAGLVPAYNRYPRVGMAGVDEHGQIRVDEVARLLEERAGRVSLVIFPGVSNVTGIITPMKEVAALAHRHAAMVLLDWAQGFAHRKMDMAEIGIDWLVASAHKAYSRGPGIMVGPGHLFPKVPDEAGGGVVRSVGRPKEVDFIDDPQAREEAGTPDFIGWIELGAAAMTLGAIGMPRVEEHELTLTRMLMGGLTALPGVTVYGDNDLARTPRVGVASFNIQGISHMVVARALNDYFAISVRNGCFCAHPYVHRLMGMSPEDEVGFRRIALSDDRSRLPGMIRPSLGLFNNRSDVLRFLMAIEWINRNKQRLNDEYMVEPSGRAVRNDGWHPTLLAILPTITAGGDLVFDD